MTNHRDDSRVRSASIDDGLFVVAIETSGRTASIALLDIGEHGDEYSEVRFLDETGRRHARSLVPELKRLFDDHHRKPAEIDCVAVAVGPGSFTGLRVGIACAKTLAWTVGCPIADVSTIEIIAQQALETVDRVAVALNAERGQLFVAEARSNGDGCQIAETRIVDASTLHENLSDGVSIAGPLPSKILQQLDESIGILPDRVGVPSAHSLAQIGAVRFREGLCSDAFAVVPEYGRLSAAEEKARNQPS